MNNATYEQRVKALAEEMAKATCAKMAVIEGSDLTWNDAGRDEQKLFIETHMPAACIAVEQRAAGIRAYAIYCAAVPADKSYTVEQYLKEQGLIPDTDREDPAIVAVKPGDTMWGHRPHNPDNSAPEQEEGRMRPINKYETTPADIKQQVEQRDKPVQVTTEQALTAFIPFQIFNPEQSARPVREMTLWDYEWARRRGMDKWCFDNGMRYQEDYVNGNIVFSLITPEKEDVQNEK